MPLERSKHALCFPCKKLEQCADQGWEDLPDHNPHMFSNVSEMFRPFSEHFPHMIRTLCDHFPNIFRKCFVRPLCDHTLNILRPHSEYLPQVYFTCSAQLPRTARPCSEHSLTIWDEYPHFRNVVPRACSDPFRHIPTMFLKFPEHAPNMFRPFSDHFPNIFPTNVPVFSEHAPIMANSFSDHSPTPFRPFSEHVFRPFSEGMTIFGRHPPHQPSSPIPASGSHTHPIMFPPTGRSLTHSARSGTRHPLRQRATVGRRRPQRTPPRRTRTPRPRPAPRTAARRRRLRLRPHRPKPSAVANLKERKA